MIFLIGGAWGNFGGGQRKTRKNNKVFIQLHRMAYEIDSIVAKICGLVKITLVGMKLQD